MSQEPSGVYLSSKQHVCIPCLRNFLLGAVSLLLSDIPLHGLCEATSVCLKIFYKVYRTHSQLSAFWTNITLQACLLETKTESPCLDLVDARFSSSLFTDSLSLCHTHKTPPPHTHTLLQHVLLTQISFSDCHSFPTFWSHLTPTQATHLDPEACVSWAMKAILKHSTIFFIWKWACIWKVTSVNTMRSKQINCIFWWFKWLEI